MKQFALLMGMVIGLGLGAGAARAASTNALTVRFNLTVTLQNPLATVTNASSTNAIFSTTKVKFGTPELLKLLGTEFNTNLPSGAQLGMTTGFRPVVLDKSGAVILDPSSNPSDSSYVFAISNNVNGVLNGKWSQTRNAETLTLNELQPDFDIYYADGSGYNFHFGGMALFHGNGVVTANQTLFKSMSLIIPNCSGGGKFLNPADSQFDDAAFTGVFGASGANLPESSD